MNPTTTNEMMALNISPMLMRDSPRSKPMSSRFGLPKMAAMMGLMTPFRMESTIFWK
jgi:hypothetical protein